MTRRSLSLPHLPCGPFVAQREGTVSLSVLPIHPAGPIADKENHCEYCVKHFNLTRGGCPSPPPRILVSASGSDLLPVERAVTLTGKLVQGQRSSPPPPLGPPSAM